MNNLDEKAKDYLFEIKQIYEEFNLINVNDNKYIPIMLNNI